MVRASLTQTHLLRHIQWSGQSSFPLHVFLAHPSVSTGMALHSSRHYCNQVHSVLSVNNQGTQCLSRAHVAVLTCMETCFSPLRGPKWLLLISLLLCCSPNNQHSPSVMQDFSSDLKAKHQSLITVIKPNLLLLICFVAKLTLSVFLSVPPRCRLPRWTVSIHIAPMSPQTQEVPNLSYQPAALSSECQRIPNRHGPRPEDGEEAGQFLQRHHLQ